MLLNSKTAITLIIIVLGSLSLQGQEFKCKTFYNLKADSSFMNMSYPKISTKPVNEDMILIHYQDFFKRNLSEVDYLHFELFNLKTESSQLIKVALDSFFNQHRTVYYQVEDFFYTKRRLYILIYKTLYILKLSKSHEVTSVQKVNIHSSYDWFIMNSRKKGVFIRLFNYCDTCINSAVTQLNFKADSISTKPQFKSFPFDGLAYLQVDNSFISHDRKHIYVGNATNSNITTIQRKKLSIDTIHLKNDLVTNSRIDSLNFQNKMQFYSALYTTDTSGYHFQTCYTDGRYSFMGKKQNKENSRHYLDIYHNSIQMASIPGGVHNYRKGFTPDSVRCAFTFDPIYSAKGTCFMPKYGLINVSFVFPTYRDNNRIWFDHKDIIRVGKEVYKSKNYTYGLYLHQMD